MTLCLSISRITFVEVILTCQEFGPVHDEYLPEAATVGYRHGLQTSEAVQISLFPP